MEEIIKRELIEIVTKYLESENENFEGAVHLVTNFSINNFISPDSLLELSDSCGLSELYSFTYIFARTCSILSTDNKTKATAHHFAGFASVLMEHYEEAEKEYKLSLEADPKNVKAPYYYGHLLHKMGRHEEAEEKYKLALEADPEYVNAHSNYGNLLKEMGREGEAEREYKFALKIDPKHANTHFNYGNLLQEMERFEEAEDEYKLALKTDPNAADIHSNYGTLLIQMKRPEEAEKEYKLALKTDPKHASTHSSYGNLLQNMERYAEAEKEYKLALEADPNYSFTHNNYGNLLQTMGRNEEAENEYKLAIEANFENATRHYNYGKFLQAMGRYKEAEKEYKLAIELDYKNPYYHAGYSLTLLSMNLQKQAIEEAKIASSKFKEKGDVTTEHLSFAWLYEDLANKYYDLKNYHNSGRYAEISGNEYLEASKHSEENLKNTLLTKGYTLKARAKIRELEIKPSFYEKEIKKYIHTKDYEIETLKIIIDRIYKASEYYEKAAEVSPEHKQICIACSTSMACFSDMLDYMLVIIKLDKGVPELEGEIENWKIKFRVCREAYKGNKKGEAFIQSLEQLQACIKNLEAYKISRIRRDERAFEECIKELLEAARNMEGPLQNILEESAEKMNIYRLKNMPYSPNQVYTSEPNRFFRVLNWIFRMLKIVIKNPIIPIIVAVISALIVLQLKKILGLS